MSDLNINFQNLYSQDELSVTCAEAKSEVEAQQQQQHVKQYALCFFSSIMKRYDHELFKLALPCLSAVAGALPPDYMESNYMAMMEKQSSMDSEGNFIPRPADTAKYENTYFSC